MYNFTCFSGKFKLLSLILFVNNCFAYSLSTTIDCLNDLNLFLASRRADTDNFQYSDADFKNNSNDNYINQVTSSNLKNCVYTDFLNFDSRENVFNSLFMLYFNIRSLQKNFDTFYEILQLLPTLPQIIGIFETKINITPLTNISIPKYTFLYANSTTRADGVGL